MEVNWQNKCMQMYVCVYVPISEWMYVQFLLKKKKPNKKPTQKEKIKYRECREGNLAETTENLALTLYL